MKILKAVLALIVMVTVVVFGGWQLLSWDLASVYANTFTLVVFVLAFEWLDTNIWGAHYRCLKCGDSCSFPRKEYCSRWCESGSG